MEDYYRVLKPDEIDAIVNKERASRDAEPRRYSKTKMDRVLGNLSGSKSKTGKSLRSLQAYLTDEQMEEADEKFGPYAGALASDVERKYFLARRDEIFTSPEFDIDPIVDTNFVLMCIMDEIILQRLLRILAKKPADRALNKQVSDVQTRYRKNMETLAATRQQRKSAERDTKVQEVDSLAVLVKQLYDNKNRRMRQLEVYEQEEEELLRQRKLKSPYDELEVVDAEVLEVNDDGEAAE